MTRLLVLVVLTQMVPAAASHVQIVFNCTYNLTPASSQSVVSGGGSHTVTISGSTGCAWTATESVSWITIDSGASGTGNGSVGYTVSANGGAQRVAVITIAGKSFTVTQAGTGSDLPAASCSSTDVQTAINAATNGQTVTIPAGNCTWSSQVSIPNTKGITLRGAGIGSTVITDNLTNNPILEIATSATRLTRVTAMTINANSVVKTGINAVIEVTGVGQNSFRVDHIHFQNIESRGILLRQEGEEITGLIDHNIFDCPEDLTCQSITVVGDGPQQNAMMDRPFEPGSSRFIFAEDNTFNYTYKNDGGMEGYGGARYVLRYNAMHGVTQGHHGADSGNYRGTHSFEIYGNVVDHTGFLDGDGLRSHHFRSGTGTVFNNSYVSNYGNFHLDNYRSDGAYGVWLECDGTSAWDGNTPGAEGYACLDQIGHVFTGTLDGTNALAPLYVWGNTKGGSQYDATVLTGTRRTTYHILANRDFYNQNASFTGTTGVGVGVIASRPATCTTGVAYWATNEGEWNSTNGATADGKMYVCTATNTWTARYGGSASNTTGLPYTYPHPLSVTP